MKQIGILTIGLLCTGLLSAQSVKEAKQSFYYENYNTAATTLHQSLKSNPADADAWYWLTQTYAVQNKADKGRDTLAKAPADAQNAHLYKVAMGHLLLQQNKKEEAQVYFNDALKSTKEKNSEVLAAVARAHVETKAGDANYAIELINKAIKRDKKNETLYALLGDAYRKLNNGTEAFKAYKEAIDKEKNFAEAYHKLGKIFKTQKNADVYLEYFNQAIEADPNYAPAYYELYTHYFYYDAAKAMDYFNQYVAKSEPSIEHEYARTDLLYINKQYQEAIAKAKGLLQKEGEEAPARMYKLIAYSLQGLKDTAASLTYMNQYFAKEVDSNFVVKDYETMAELYATMDGMADSAAHYYQKAINLEKDSTTLYAYYQKVADLYKNTQNYSQQAKWMGKYYTNNSKATNVDLFNWGLAHYRAQEYQLADSVFGMYVAQHPDQGFGYYWQARSNALLDTNMAKGSAIPHYENLIRVIEKDTAASDTDKKWLIEAYNYLAAYQTNTLKDYAAAIAYFEKVLEVDPGNEDAQRYIAILKKNLEASGGDSKSTSATNQQTEK